MDSSLKYSNLNKQARAEISTEEAIKLIEKYGGIYNSDYSNFDVWEQLEISERLYKSIPTNQEYININKTDNNTGVNGMINVTCKRQVNFVLTLSKQQIITQLKACNYRTSPKIIAGLLDQFFSNPSTIEGHWLFIAQHWNPRAINRTIEQLIKIHVSGKQTIQNPAAYFTFLIKFRKKRRD